MSETPKCPYCGAEMLEGCYTWTCPKCYSNSPVVIWYEEKVKGMNTEEKRAYAREAALHRAEPETRPLTLDEIYAKIDDEDWNVAWIEVPDSQKAEPMCPFYKEENKIVFCAPPFSRVWKETISRYGKSWRCWPRKPTPEQMAAEKWEE